MSKIIKDSVTIEEWNYWKIITINTKKPASKKFKCQTEMILAPCRQATFVSTVTLHSQHSCFFFYFLYFVLCLTYMVASHCTGFALTHTGAVTVSCVAQLPVYSATSRLAHTNAHIHGRNFFTRCLSTCLFMSLALIATECSLYVFNSMDPLVI